MATEKVSGTGKFAKRVDKNISKRTTQPMREMGSTKYGEGKALLEQQQGAKLQGQPTNIPAEVGLPFGEGPGPEIFGNLNPEPETLTGILGRMVNADASGEVKAIYENALLQGQ